MGDFSFAISPFWYYCTVGIGTCRRLNKYETSKSICVVMTILRLG